MISVCEALPWESEVPDEPNEAGAVQAFGSEGTRGCRFGARLPVLSHSKTRSSTVNSTLVTGRFGGVEIGDLPGWQISALSLRHSKVKGTLHGSGLTGSSVYPAVIGPVIPALACRSRKSGTLLR